MLRNKTFRFSELNNSNFLADGGFEMIKAFFVDFYGSLVHEDGAVIKQK